ncbi:hypothetical protein HYH02_013703 [Chlamydomonas schloesseri]|uniref:Glycosyltransferase family 92 protein n=1 Tax=Chlamydomonas schloesseri TaxID=2026947 RepID=A0A835VVC2_9CHLO|nr:hypothetical protein HYH02_013703 [Chlamydomonas schloesseri]|eukprot:KAG2430707.1 hypothetical protein HYH02_013703 [Chlamydomonas schloesseri]
MFAVAPLVEAKRSATVVMQPWARRVGGPDVAFGLPHQKQAALRVMLWVDYTGDLHLRAFGHLRLPVDQDAWAPQLVLEGPAPLPPLNASMEPSPELVHRVTGQWLRPYSLRFELPPAYVNITCFRLLELSYPGHKAPFCVPLEGLGDAAIASSSRDRGVDNTDDVRRASVCEELAPRDKHTDSSPALWAAIGPPRHAHSTRDWGGHLEQVAIRTVHYLAYHVAMGVSGLLLYTDAVQRHYLRQVPALQPYLRGGQLRLVQWDLPERNHEDDGRGRPLGYNYDQALFASHALLGLSGCGANLALMISDLDEYLYGTKPNARWPEPYARCIPRTAGGPGGRPVVVHTLQRMEMLSSAVPPEGEARLWTQLPDTSNPQAPPQHPLVRYDRRKPTPMTHNMHNKPIVLPAGEIVMFFVHEGAPLRGEQQIVDGNCVLLMHVANYWRARSNNGQYRRFNVSTFLPFQHWIFDPAQNGGAGVTYPT